MTFYYPARGQCRCPDAGLKHLGDGRLGHEYRETGGRGGVYVLVCTSCLGAVVPDFDRALCEAQARLRERAGQ